MLVGDDPFTTVEEAAEFYAAAYRRFIFVRGVIDPSPIELLNPSAFKLRRPRKSFLDDQHAFTAELFAQVAANRVNSLCTMLVGLKSWQSILPDYGQKQRYYLEVEFVSPILQLAIAEIAGIKNQIAFSVGKLAIQIESAKTRGAIPRNDEITGSTWESWANQWTGFRDFQKSLKAINPRVFRSATRDFRNRRAHAVAPSFFGIIPAHVVTRDRAGWKMQIRFEEKLDIATLAQVLEDQHVALVELVEEMRDFLRARFDPRA